MANPLGGMARVVTIIGVLAAAGSAPAAEPPRGCPERWPVWATDDPRNENPAWSPDARWLAFDSTRSGRSQIYVLRVSDCAVRQVTSRGDGAWDPDWSPDGRELVFTGSRDEQLWIVTADGRTARRLTSGPGSKKFADWSPSGRAIVYARGSDAGAHRLFSVRPDGGGRRALGRGTAPAWSRDGARIAFVRSDRPWGEVWVMRADGSGRRRVMVGGAQDLAWGPDSRRLAVGKNHPRLALSLFVKPFGRPLRHLRRTGNAWAPDWSAVSGLIAFTRTTGDPSTDLYVIRPDGRDMRRLTVTPLPGS
jgi:Tol biopolymer transport system component